MRRPTKKTKPEESNNQLDRYKVYLREIKPKHPDINPATNRPYGISAEQRAKLIQAIRVGNFFEVACQYAGIKRATFDLWMVKGGDELSTNAQLEFEPVEPYASFAQDVRAAEAEGEVRAVARIEAHGNVDWRADAWLLQKRRKERWGEEKSAQIASAGGVTIILPDNNRSKTEESNG